MKRDSRAESLLYCTVHYTEGMDLHRTTGKPDWESIPEAKQTLVQKIAAATRGIITPPNIITVIGLALVVYGLFLLLSKYYWTGLILVAVGRALDIVDGAVAQKTNTKSPLGEIFDAAADKFGTLFTLIALFAAQITFWWLLAVLLIPQIIITLISFYKKASGAKTHPTRQGKLSMAALWAALIGFIVAKALDLAAAHPFEMFVYALALVSTVLAVYAAIQYARQR